MDLQFRKVNGDASEVPFWQLIFSRPIHASVSNGKPGCAAGHHLYQCARNQTLRHLAGVWPRRERQFPQVDSPRFGRRPLPLASVRKSAAPSPPSRTRSVGRCPLNLVHTPADDGDDKSHTELITAIMAFSVNRLFRCPVSLLQIAGGLTGNLVSSSV